MKTIMKLFHSCKYFMLDLQIHLNHGPPEIANLIPEKYKIPAMFCKL